MKDNLIFLDSNVCLYLVSEQSRKKHVAETVLAKAGVIISSQVINENINIRIKKLKLTHELLGTHIDFLLLNCQVVSLTPEIQKAAIDLHFRYRYSYYDSLIIATALDAGCNQLFSEDMQHGMVIEKRLSIINSFL